MSLTSIINSSVRKIRPQIFTTKCFNNSKSLSNEASIESHPYDLHLLEESPATTANLTREDALLYIHQMMIIRKMENTAAELYKARHIRGFCHLYCGQEACLVGLKAIMRPGDTITTSYRCHAQSYVMGEPIENILGELCAKVTGCSRGKGGSMHMYGKNFFGGNGIVGSQVPLGTGVGFAHKYRNNGNISITLYGDGAANQGQVFEAFNIACLKKLPVLYICENNLYGMGTSLTRSSANCNYYKICTYIPGIRLDGMDVLSVREATKFAFDYINQGNGPILLEFVTYRYFGHSMTDPGTSYRSREEVQEVRKSRDPITLFREKIVASGLATAEEIDEIDKKTKKAVADAAKKALGDKETPVVELTYDLYSKCDFRIRGVNVWHKHEHKNTGPTVQEYK